MVRENAETASVRRQLEEVNRRLRNHPLNSDEFTRARALMKGTSPEDRAEVNAALREQGLPGVGTQMRMMLFGLGSLARLNRRRLRLENLLGGHDADGQDGGTSPRPFP